MNVLILDGHPDAGRLLQHLLDVFVRGLSEGCQVTRIAVRDLVFEPNLRRGFSQEQPWEADLQRAAQAIAEADHIVIAFPLWWGAEPALFKGFIDRVLLPGFAFRYRSDSPMWHKLLEGRSVDVIVTMDTPPPFLRWVWGNPVEKRWRKQILGFVGCSPIRFHALGMTRRGGVKKNLGKWEERLTAAAKSATTLRRSAKNMPEYTNEALAKGVAERAS